MAIYKISENSMRIEYDFIPKQKIRDKIKEYQNKMEEDKENLNLLYAITRQAVITVLEDLLKE